MKQPSIQIRIPKPCSESWEQMDATGRGAFCKSCQTEVIDFSTMTDREVIEYLEKNKTECGQFREDQLNRTLVMRKMKNGLLKWRAIALGLLTVVSFKSVFASRSKPHTLQMSETNRTGGNVNITSDTITISGYVKNEKDEPFAGVYIALADKTGDDRMGAYASTDTSGHFTMIINKKDKRLSHFHAPFHLEICNIQYHTKRVRVIDKTEQRVDVTLHKHHHRLIKGRLSECQ